MTERAHGTRTKFVHDGCRCLPCRSANSLYQQRLYRRQGHSKPYKVRAVGYGWFLVRENHDGHDGEIVHRTKDRDEAFRVRDEFVAAAGIERDDTWAPPWLRRDVCKHVEALRAHGVGLRRIATVAGVSRSRIVEIVQRAPGRMRVETAEKILGVPLDAAHGQGLVPAAPTWTRLHCLIAAGATRSAIAKALGNVNPALQIRRERVYASTARKVAELHEAAWRSSPRVREVCRCGMAA